MQLIEIQVVKKCIDYLLMCVHDTPIFYQQLVFLFEISAIRKRLTTIFFVFVLLIQNHFEIVDSEWNKQQKYIAH